MQGLHLTADLAGCPADGLLFTDPSALRALCLRAVLACDLQPVGELFHRFGPAGGVTGVVLLAESHLALHTWPELAAVTLDVYVCNFNGDNTRRAESLLAALEAAFAPKTVERHRLLRGQLGRDRDETVSRS
jgi:S-adenosylmethionine decarboxylase proenzyme